MNFIKIRNFLTIFTMMIAIVAVPNTASARGSVHIELPHFSLGFNGGHHNKYLNRHNKHNNYHNRQNRQHNNYHNRHHNSYQPYYGSSYKTYRQYQPQPRYYQQQPRYSQPRYQNQSGYCPTPGYSSSYYNGGGCYEHGDHYHCDQ